MLRSASSIGLGFIKPELPILVPEPPTGEGWIHEIKYDGYRTLIAIDRGQVRAFTRNGHDWTAAYRRVVAACTKLACETAMLDGEMAVQDEHGITDFQALRSAIYTSPHRIVFFVFDLLQLDGQDLRRTPLIERRAALRRLIEPGPRSPIQFSDHADCDGALLFKHAAELGLEGIVSKRARSLHRGGPSKNWLKTKNMVEGEFILLGTEIDDSGIPWALLAREQDGRLEFAGPAIIRPPSHARGEWADRFAAVSIEQPALKGLRRVNRARWLKPEIRVRAQYLKAKGTLRHATVKAVLPD